VAQEAGAPRGGITQWSFEKGSKSRIVDEVFPGIRTEWLSDPVWGPLLASGAGTFVAFTFVAARLAGLALVGPVFGHPRIPMRLRALLVAALSLVVTPALVSLDHRSVFERLDHDHDGELAIDEVSPAMQPQFQTLLAQAGKADSDRLSADEFRSSIPIPGHLLEYAWAGLTELAVGLALGLGVMTIFSSLQLAGWLIDQQLGLSLGELFNPDLGINANLSGEILHQFGLAAFFIAGGHVQIVSALLDTFMSLPVGFAWIGPPVYELLAGLVHQSFALAIQVAAPVLATMALVGLALGFLGRTLPQLGAAALGAPVRLFVGLALLGLSLAGIGELLGAALPDAMFQLHEALTGLSAGAAG
jgi:flagellar biosynthetic protein FliR